MYYAVTKRDGVGIHRAKRSDGGCLSQYHRTLYIFVNDIEKVNKNCKDRNMPL